MIIKGASRSGGAALGNYLVNAKNEDARVIEIRGTVANDPRGALLEMEAYAAGTRCEKPIYHAIISPEPPHRLTPDQMLDAVNTLEKRLGLERQPRVVVAHEHEGREHLHIGWSRIDVETMRSIHMSQSYRTHEIVARELEDRFGHPRVQGVHTNREGPNGEKVARPERTPSLAEMRQEERTGIRGRDVKSEVTAAFKTSDNAQAFTQALLNRGYRLAQGDFRDFVIVDREGGVHSLARRIEGVKAAQLREFMGTIDPATIPTVEAAQRFQAQRQQQKEDRFEARVGRGDDYVNQSQAAQQQFKERSRKLNRKRRERIQNQQAQRAQKEEQVPAPQRSEDLTSRFELTDAMQTKLDRLRSEIVEAFAPDRGAGRQNQAPGGGRAGGR
jgi:hypothetical protein